jgi:hypothetical protein
MPPKMRTRVKGESRQRRSVIRPSGEGLWPVALWVQPWAWAIHLDGFLLSMDSYTNACGAGGAAGGRRRRRRRR